MLIGTDVELFLIDNEGKHISAAGLVQGSKHEPHSIGVCEIHPDNVALELTMPPASNEDEWVENISSAMAAAKDYVGLGFSYAPSHVFPEDQLQHPGAMEFGCEGDFDAFSQSMNNKPSPENGLRCCGGHIHVNVENKTLDNVRNMVLLMDIYLGVPSVLFDADTDRKKLYGKASCYRLKKYGFEYRSLSNFWVRNEKLMRWVYRNTLLVTQSMLKVTDTMAEEVRDCINNHDIKKAKELIVKYQIPLL